MDTAQKNLIMSKYRPRLTDKEYELVQNFRNGNNVGIIGDTHEPFCHPDYLNFCYETFNKFGCTNIVHIGDEVDNHALSYHEHDPDGFGASKEAELAQKKMEKWYETFPEVKVCVGNHSALPFRKAMTYGIPKRFMKTYEEIWSAPKGWKWEMHWEIDNVIYEHGTGSSGPSGHRNRAVANRQSTVVGHSHSFGGVAYMASRNDLIFGMNVGCGIDIDSYAMAYGKGFPKKPTLGCGIVLDGGRIATFVPMDLGTKYTWK